MQQLAAFDGRHTAPLEALAASLEASPRAIGRLLDVLEATDEPRLEVAATWVVLALCKGEDGVRLSAGEASRLAAALAAVEPWEAALHILQTLAMVDLATVLSPAERKGLASAALRLSGAGQKKPFVRAWSLSVLARVAPGLPRAGREAVAAAVRAEEASGPASVRARVRQMRAAGLLEWITGEG
jgi:hypothetical protein